MAYAKLIYFADIYCPWCYAFAPAIRRLHSEFPDIPVHVVGGGLIGQPTGLLKMRMEEPGLEQFWRGVHEETGRSFTGILGNVAADKDTRMDSIGADALFLALSRLAPDKELEQFTQLEEMVFANGLDLFDQGTIASLAGQYQVSAEELSSLASDPAMRDNAVQEIKETARLLGGSAAFPTVFLMRGETGEFVSQGYVHYETVASRMGDAMRDLHLEPLVPHDKMSRHGELPL